MVAGNQARMPVGILKRRADTDCKYRDRNGICDRSAPEALIATGVVLFVFILIINFSVALLNRRSGRE